MSNETELKKAWNLIIDNCEKSAICEDCIFVNECRVKTPADNEMIEIQDEE